MYAPPKWLCLSKTYKEVMCTLHVSVRETFVNTNTTAMYTPPQRL